MKKLLLLSIAATFISSISFATIRRVGFFGPAVSGVDFNSFQLAHNAANIGDTIMMMPGTQLFDATMTKRLTVIGPGYFLNENTGLQAFERGMDSSSQALRLSNASVNGSVFIGCTVGYYGVEISGTGIENITFKRCWFSSNAYSAVCIRIYESTVALSNITFDQCAFKGGGLQASVPCTNMSFLNCLFYTKPNSGAFGTLQFLNTSSNSGTIKNCVFSSDNNGSGTQGYSAFLYGSWLVLNCISNTGNFSGGVNILYQNCIGTATQFPAGNGNKQNIAWNTIFNLTGSADGMYTLKAGSPAIGAGINGAVATDCGIFGGATPYRLSGIPSVPTIYQLTSPQGTIPAGNTVQINLGTRSNN